MSWIWSRAVVAHSVAYSIHLMTTIYGSAYLWLFRTLPFPTTWLPCSPLPVLSPCTAASVPVHALSSPASPFLSLFCLLKSYPRRYSRMPPLIVPLRNLTLFWKVGVKAPVSVLLFLCSSRWVWVSPSFVC